MHTTEVLRSSTILSSKERWARKIVLELLSKLTCGNIEICEKFEGGENLTFGSSSTAIKIPRVEIYNPMFYVRSLKGGSIGAAESFVDGEWHSDDLTLTLQVMAENIAALDELERKSSWITRSLCKLAHYTNRNSLKGSKQNISAHYDLGNDLYSLFLDSNMLYSSALYLGTQESLEQAQVNKMDRLCQQLELCSDDHVLEIGTGWGAMAIYMASEYGCKVTTTTISDEQFSYTQDKIQELGLEKQITLLKQDYRLLTGEFDKIVSIEMIEAVGKSYLDSYIQQCYRRLKPGGKLAIQAITIADQRYEYYSKNVDFIQKYIFPGGFLPSITRLLASTTNKTDFVLRDLKDIGIDYAKTLEVWRHRFLSNIEHLDSDKYDVRFQRLWLFYLCYCEAGFRAKTTSTVQVMFEKNRSS
jgi:cyclopropane-fatty-acyl-phospholipid synthase